MDTFDTFEAHVKDALKHFYEPAHLETHPLIVILALDVSLPLQGASLRKVLLGAIEALRPAEAVPFHEPGWRAYRIMRQRYVDVLPQSKICQELGLSRASLYRCHREALDAVTKILWQRRRPTSDQPAGSSPSEHLELSQAQSEATRLASTLPSVAVDAGVIADSVAQVMGPLARHRGIALSIEISEPSLQVYGDATMLRQILINVLSEVVAATQGGTITCEVHRDRGRVVWRIASASLLLSIDQMEATPGFAVARSLLLVYGGDLHLEQSDVDTIVLLEMAVPEARMILVIDDDLDTLRLYREYLSSEDYALVGAHSADEAYEVLERITPDLVLLDVLMPGDDGWALLQQLKMLPAKAEIPVVICSVLTQPQLALALGAAAVLQKPISQGALLHTTRRLLSRDSPS